MTLCDRAAQNFLLSGCQCVSMVMSSRGLAILVLLIGPACLSTRPLHLETRREREAVRYKKNHDTTTVNKYCEYFGRPNALTARFTDFQLTELIADMFKKLLFNGTPYEFLAATETTQRTLPPPSQCPP
jgi:hypothetical protein